ncbi:MAG: hypothetical protein ACP5UN_00900 [Candidatus Micrarchaeia archaeon]
MKSQFALFEVFISFIILLSSLAVISNYYYLTSINSYKKNIDYSNLYYDFFNALYKNKTLQNCAYTSNNNCLLILKNFSSTYMVDLRFTFNQNVIETSNFDNCTIYNFECVPFKNINTQDYIQACLSICSNQSD